MLNLCGNRIDSSRQWVRLLVERGGGEVSETEGEWTRGADGECTYDSLTSTGPYTVGQIRTN